MRLHRITYTRSGESRQEFAGSESDASKRGTALKMVDGIDKKSISRAPVDVPTDKGGLIEWLNKNASMAVEA